MIVERFNANQVRPSSLVGLHPQMLAFDVIANDGANVGFNKVQTAPPGGSVTYRWYAGEFKVSIFGGRFSIPIEFGSTNLISSDRIKHGNKGAIGGLIIEPRGSTWTEDASSRASATVTPPGGVAFREFVLLFQNDVNLRFGDGSAVPNTAEAEDPEDSARRRSIIAPSRCGSGWGSRLTRHLNRPATLSSPTRSRMRWWAAIRSRRCLRLRPGLPCGSAFCSRPDMRATACSRFTAISGKRSPTPQTE